MAWGDGVSCFILGGGRVEVFSSDAASSFIFGGMVDSFVRGGWSEI